ncbi:MAG: hypothetical protein ACLFV6_18700 [Spirulinaceae cyanobacterium]
MKQLLNKLPIEIPKRLSLKAMWRLILNRRRWVIGGGIVVVMVVSLSWWAIAPGQRVQISEWQSLEQTFAPTQQAAWQERLLQDHYAPGFTASVLASSIQIKEIRQSQATLYWIDFNHPTACGAAGCLHSVYSSQGQQLLSLFLQTANRDRLFSVRPSREPFPRLIIAQPGDDAIAKVEFVYTEGQYQGVNSQRFESKSFQKLPITNDQ